MQTFDAIVLGMGAMGAAAAYQLAKRGVRVLGIDQYDPPHQQGSTHGETRITRIACGEGENYAPFARRSHEIWREAERELGIGPGALLTQNGMILIAGPKEQRGHGISAFLTRTFSIAANVGVPAERLSASDGGAVSNHLRLSVGTVSGPDALQNFPAPANTYAKA